MCNNKWQRQTILLSWIHVRVIAAMMHLISSTIKIKSENRKSTNSYIEKLNHTSVTLSHTVKIKSWLYGHSRSGRGHFFWPTFFNTITWVIWVDYIWKIWSLRNFRIQRFLGWTVYIWTCYLTDFGVLYEAWAMCERGEQPHGPQLAKTCQPQPPNMIQINHVGITTT